MKALLLIDRLTAHNTWGSVQHEGHLGVLAARYRKDCLLLLAVELERSGIAVVLVQERFTLCFVGVLAL